MPKKLTLLVLHCTATPEGRFVGPDQIRDWHLSPPPKGRGWKQVGYTDMILLSGVPVRLVANNEDDTVDAWEITNGVAGINYTARHIVYVGGTDKKGAAKDTRTKEQLLTMTSYVRNFVKKHPQVKVAGHNQFASKACPSFDVPAWLKSIGIADQNIYKP
jgi:N-acetylmuramoyl-L-alanine amidase